jgi:sec-independent protein translocase protein TatC
MDPLQIYNAAKGIDHQIKPPALTTLSAQESMMVYFKVTVIAGFVLACPWVFWQIWSFVAKGLYPNEKRYVYWAIGPSTVLFVTGVLMCQFVVMPQAVSGLLWFNDFLGFTPDLRLNEWLSLAIMMPVVFGISFETPLIMVVLQKLGIMTPDDFRKKRKYAYFGLAIFAMVITPTGDALTMLYLMVPMWMLYESGIWICRFLPGGVPEEDSEINVPDSEEPIEV